MGEATWEEVGVHQDDRGVVFEPLDASLLGQQRNLHVVINRPGAVRGNHYHRRATEYVSVCGPARVCYASGGAVCTVQVAAQSVLRFCFPPGVAHAIENTGDRDQVLVALSDQPHDPHTPDTLPSILITAGA